MYVGTMSTLFVQNDTLTGGTSGATATVATGNGSWYFDGVNDSVRVDTGVTLGTDSFTLECWVRRNDANTSFYASGSNANDFNFYLGAGTSNVGFWGGNSANWININQLNGVTTSPNTWIHMAFVRDTAQNGDDCSIYLNGILQGTGTMTTNYNLTQFVVGAPYVGYSGGNTADGYISDWRVSSTAVYQRGTSTVGDTVFSTPTRAFIASDVTETEVLLCQGSPIQDNGPNSFNLTTYGGGPVGTGTSPFGFFPGVSSAFDWYTSPTNVKILEQARQIQSPISGQTSSPNLYTFPENLGYNSFSNTQWYSNVQTAPDGTQTADKLFGVGGGTHFMYRGYNLTAYETFDSTGRRFDSTNETFDTGYPGISEQQQFTLSAFFKKAELGSLNFKFAMDSQTKNINFNVDLFTGQIAEASVFVSPGITLDDYGVTPVGDDWFRVHATASFGFGIANVYLDFALYNRANINATYGQGFYVWGIKLNSGALDPYTANSGQLFYSNAEYNIKTYALGLLQQFMIQSLTNELISPSTAATISSFYQDPNGSDALTNGVYSETSVSRLIRLGVSTITKQLADDTHYPGITQINGCSLNPSDAAHEPPR